MPILKGIYSDILIVGYHIWNSHKRGGIHSITKYFAQKGKNVHLFRYPVPIYRYLKTGVSLKMIADDIVPKVFTLGNAKIVSSVAITAIGHTRYDNYFSSNLKTFINEFIRFSIPFIKFEQYKIVVIESWDSLISLNWTNNAQKIIYRASDPIFTYSDNQFLLKLEDEIIKRADVILTVNCIHQEMFLKKGDNLKEKTFMWRNIFDPHEYSSVKTSPYKPGEKIAIYYGAYPIEWRYIEQAAKINKDWNIVIIGPDLLDSYGRKVIKHNNNVRYLGGMNERQALKYIKFADVGLLPYKYKPALKYSDISHKVLHYMYCGLPIIAPYYLGNLKRYGVYLARSFDEFGSLINELSNTKINYDASIDFASFSEKESFKTLDSIFALSGIL